MNDSLYALPYVPYSWNMVNPSNQSLSELGRLNLSMTQPSSTDPYSLTYRPPASYYPTTRTPPSEQGNEFAFNIPTAKLVLDGIGALGNLYAAKKSLGLARDQFNFNKQFAQTNLLNQTTAYNTKLEDRLRNRAFLAQDQSSKWKEDFERLKARTA